MSSRRVNRSSCPPARVLPSPGARLPGASPSSTSPCPPARVLARPPACPPARLLPARSSRPRPPSRRAPPALLRARTPARPHVRLNAARPPVDRPSARPPACRTLAHPCYGCHNTAPPAAPRPPLRLRIAACPRRCGTVRCRWGGLAAACATVTRALLGLLLLAAPPPCCYSLVLANGHRLAALRRRVEGPN